VEGPNGPCPRRRSPGAPAASSSTTVEVLTGHRAQVDADVDSFVFLDEALAIATP
jgi:hypothetical protein